MDPIFILAEEVMKLKNTYISKEIKLKEKEFISKRFSDWDVRFIELCFCILAAGFNAKRSLFIQDSINKGFLYYDKNKLSLLLKNFGHRFPNKRAEYIVESREKYRRIDPIITNSEFSSKEKRDILIKNIKGVGLKEASHFLRNIGFFDVAIIDFHILNLLKKRKIVENIYNLSKKNYLYVENILQKISKIVNIPLGILDLYLWYMETGEIIK